MTLGSGQSKEEEEAPHDSSIEKARVRRDIKKTPPVVVERTEEPTYTPCKRLCGRLGRLSPKRRLARPGLETASDDFPENARSIFHPKRAVDPKPISPKPVLAKWEGKKPSRSPSCKI